MTAWRHATTTITPWGKTTIIGARSISSRLLTQSPLMLRDDSADLKLIAEALAIEAEGVDGLLEIAQAKLQQLQTTTHDTKAHDKR